MKTDFFRAALLQSRAYNQIKNDFAEGKPGHAYLIVSADSEALRQLFQMVAATAFCPYGGCLECAECQKVFHFNHPDIKHVNLLNEKIGVAEVAKITADAQLKSFLGGNKLFMVYNAEQMNDAAQNKLLKTLEEPPGQTIFFLGTSNETKILDTIKSRSRKIYIDIFDDKTVYDAVFGETENAEKARLAAAYADGLLSKAFEIAENENFSDAYKSAVRMLRDMKSAPDFAKFVSASVFAKDNVLEFLDILAIILRDVMVSPSNKGLVMSKHIGQDIEALSRHYSPTACAAALKGISAARAKLSLNVSAQAVTEKLFFDILETRT